MMHDFIRYAYIYIWHRVRVGVTHRIRGNFGFGEEVVVVVVEVVEVDEVAIRPELK